MNFHKFLLQTPPSKLLLFHILLGALGVISKFFVIIWMLWGLYSLFKIRQNDYINKIIVITYLVGMEIICRMVGTSPFIPYEFGKYLLILAPLLFSNVKIGNLSSLLLLLPGIIMGLLEDTSFLLIVFNVFGWLALVTFRMLSKNIIFSKEQFQRLLIAAISGSVSALFIAFFKSPDASDVEFSYDANFATSGGFAPNQVATSLGLGIGILGFLMINRINVLSSRVIGILFIFYIYRGILTFSRGGIIIGILAIIAVFFLNSIYQGKNLLRNILLLAFISLTIFIGGYFINNISDGFLYKRLTGETIGTEYGIKDRSINTLTSGRMNIFEQDMEIFGEYFPLGTGVHISTLKRAERENIPEPVASHVELSRLLAEHGILGLIFLITTFSWFIRSYKEQMTGLGKYFVVFCFIFSIGTTFHSATRTFITPLMGGLAMIRIAPDRKRTSSEL